MAENATPERKYHRFPYPVAASTLIEQGTMVGVNASGYAVPMNGPELAFAGMALSTVNNTGSAGSMLVECERSIYRWANSEEGDEISLSDVGKRAYAHTATQVGLTPGDNDYSDCGVIAHVDALGVWVDGTNLSYYVEPEDNGGGGGGGD